MALTPFEIHDYMQTFVDASDLSRALRKKVMTRLFSQLVEEKVGSYESIHRSLVYYTEYYANNPAQLFLSNKDHEDVTEQILSILTAVSQSPLDRSIASEEAASFRDSPSSGGTPEEIIRLLKSKISGQCWSILENLLSHIDASKLSHYSMDKLPSIVAGIEERIDKYGGLCEQGIVDKRRVTVTFRTSPIAIVSHGYDPDTANQIHELLSQGAPFSAIARIVGLEVPNLYYHLPSLPPVSRSPHCPSLSLFVETRLREAAEKGYTPAEAARYAGISSSSAREFWRKIMHDYLSPGQKQKVREGIGQGMGITRLCSHSHLRSSDVIYACRLMELPYHGSKEQQPPVNPSVNRCVNRPVGQAPQIVRLLSDQGMPITSVSLSDYKSQTYHPVTISAASHMLSRAYKLGILDRRKQGHVYVYYPKQTGSEPVPVSASGPSKSSAGSP